VAEEVGVAYVSLVPSARRFGREAEREVRKEMRGRGIPIRITPEVDRAQLRAAMVGLGGNGQSVSVPVRVEVDRSQVTREFATISRTERVRVRTEVDGETTRISLRRWFGRPDGERSGREWGDGWTTGASHGIRRSRGRVNSEIDRTGRHGGRRTSDGVRQGLLTSLVGAIGSAFQTIAGNAVIGTIAATLGIAIAVPLVSAIGAALATAFTLGGGLGVIGLGAWLLREDPAVQEAASRFGDRLKATFADAAKPLIGPFVESLGMLEQLLIDIGPDLRSMFETIAPAVRPLTEGLIGFIKGAMPGFLDLLEAAVPMITDLASTLPRFGEDLGYFFSVIAEVGPGASMFLRDFLNILGIVFMAVGDWINWLTKMYLFTSTTLHSVAEILRQAVVGWGYIIDGVVGTVRKAAAILVAIFQAIRREVLNTARFFGTIPGRVRSALSGAGSLLFNAGRNIIQGLINGITSRFSGLRNVISNAAGLIRAHLPFSPAKMGPLSGSGNPFYSGQSIAELLAGGMESRLPVVTSASSALAGSVGFGGRSSTVAAAGGGFSVSWAPGATGDQLLDALRHLIEVRFGGDPGRALGGG
jgi:hypothetical protein